VAGAGSCGCRLLGTDRLSQGRDGAWVWQVQALGQVPHVLSGRYAGLAQRNASTVHCSVLTAYDSMSPGSGQRRLCLGVLGRCVDS
jgi:hypothetical protein